METRGKNDVIGYEKEEYENNLTSVEHIQSGKLYWMILDADYMEYLKRIDPHIPDHDYGYHKDKEAGG